MSKKDQKARSVKRFWLFIATLGAAVMLAACAGEPGIDPREIGDPERGREIYETGGGIPQIGTRNSCIVCHSLDGSVGYEPSGPSFKGISRRAADRVPEMSAVEYLRQSIVDPRAYLVEGYRPLMPTVFGQMGEEDINALVAFLLTQ